MISQTDLVERIKINLRIRKWPFVVFFFLSLFIKYGLGVNFSFFVVIATLVMLVINTGMSLFVNHGLFKGREGSLHQVHLVQLIIDILMITVVVHFIGGISYMGFIFYTFFIVYGIIAFSRRDFYIQIATIVISYLSLTLLEFFEVIKFQPVFDLSNEIYKNPYYVVSSLIVAIGSFYFLAIFAKIPAERLEEITERLNQANVELEKNNQELANLDQIKSSFISLASHQLRAPLSGIKWGLDDFKSRITDRLSAEELDDFKKINGLNNKVIELVNDLLDISRIEEKRFNYEFRPCNIEEIIRDSAGGLISLLAKKRVDLKFDFPKEKIPYLSLDRDKMMVAIENIIENAIKYNMEKGSILVKVEKKSDEVIISIKDSGLGIPKSQQGKIFTKFFRADNVVKFQTEGTGLGLFIVKNIILGHRGKIWFDSQEGVGTTFYVSLPLA